QPNHSFTRTCRVGEGVDNASDVCRNGNKKKQNESQPRTIMEERSSGRNYGWQQASIKTPRMLRRRSQRGPISENGLCSSPRRTFFLFGQTGPLTNWLISA